MLPILYAVFPKDFDRFIDVFGGSGSVLLGKPPSRFEVYNDIDGELVNLFRVAKNRIAELLLELDFLPLNSREEFDAWLHFHEGANDPAPYLPAQLEMFQVLDRAVQKYGLSYTECCFPEVNGNAKK